MADPWDWFKTLEEAEAVQEFLTENPYILNYCDCCNHEGSRVTLLKVVSSEIVPWRLNKTLYSVQTKVEVIANIPYLADGPDMKGATPEDEHWDYYIKMNYTWGYHPEKKVCAPLYAMVPFGNIDEPDSGFCKPFTNFPDPATIKNEDYTRWFERSF
jgi:hypothetical protein